VPYSIGLSLASFGLPRCWRETRARRSFHISDRARPGRGVRRDHSASREISDCRS